MVEADEKPIIDFVLRSVSEQRRLYDKGLSKCDGTKKVSNHQRGLAMDIYLCTSDTLGDTRIEFEWDKAKSEKWHKRWVEMGGKELIVFADGTEDRPHFEGR